MIAKVRIAPVERWCAGTEPLRDDGEVGCVIEIDTASMRKNNKSGGLCGGVSWEMTERSAQMLESITGQSYDRPLKICEHMLEMD